MSIHVSLQRYIEAERQRHRERQIDTKTERDTQRGTGKTHRLNGPGRS